VKSTPLARSTQKTSKVPGWKPANIFHPKRGSAKSSASSVHWTEGSPKRRRGNDKSTSRKLVVRIKEHSERKAAAVRENEKTAIKVVGKTGEDASVRVDLTGGEEQKPAAAVSCSEDDTALDLAHKLQDRLQN
jgi:hypothetical protein